MTGYTSVTMVRDYLAKIGVENISDEAIQQAIDSASSDCDMFSGKTGWLQTDTYFQTIVGCTIQLAQAYCLSILDGKDVTEMNQWTIAMARLTGLREKLTQLGIVTSSTPGGTGGTEGIPKHTYPANPEGEVIYIVRTSGITQTHENDFDTVMD